MSFDLVALKDERPAAAGARPRRSLDLEAESVVRALPIRWRLLSIAALNATVAVILAALIWNGANVLSRAWDEVRKVRESDKLLVLLESEAEPPAEPDPSLHQSAEPGGAHGNPGAARRGARARCATAAPSIPSLRVGRRAARGDRTVPARASARCARCRSTIAHTYENEVLKPAREMAGLYAIIEGAIGRRDALLTAVARRSRARRSPPAWSPPMPSICRSRPTPPTKRDGTSTRSSRPSRS